MFISIWLLIHPSFEKLVVAQGERLCMMAHLCRKLPGERVQAAHEEPALVATSKRQAGCELSQQVDEDLFLTED